MNLVLGIRPRSVFWGLVMRGSGSREWIRTSSSSSDSGSGTGPSKAHLLVSYLDLMNDSILL